MAGMIAVRCLGCQRQFCARVIAEHESCPFCGARKVTALDGRPDALPAVMEPPAIERRVITERINQAARALVLSALAEQERES